MLGSPTSSDVRCCVLALIAHEEFARGEQYEELSASVRASLFGTFDARLRSRVGDGYPGARVELSRPLPDVPGNPNAWANGEWTIAFPTTVLGLGPGATVRLRHYKARVITEFHIAALPGEPTARAGANPFRTGRLARTILERCGIVEALRASIGRPLGSYTVVMLPETFEEIPKENLQDELDTTFFFETVDPKRRSRLSATPCKILIRISHPSVIATRMHDSTFARLLNTVYTAFLYRRREGENDAAAFRGLRTEIEKDFGDRQTRLAEERQRSLLGGIQIATIAGAVAGLAAILFFLPWQFANWLPWAKTLVALAFLAGIGLAILLDRIGYTKGEWA